MRNWILVTVAVAFAMGMHPIAQTKDNNTVVCRLKVAGMTCVGCESAMKIAAKRVDGVKSVTASARTGTADVIYDVSNTSPEAIAKAVTTNSGFKAEVAKKLTAITR